MSDEPRDEDQSQDPTTPPAGSSTPDPTPAGSSTPDPTPAGSSATEPTPAGSSASDPTPAGRPRSEPVLPDSSPSAPWERPRRWNQDELDAPRVDDLLVKLGGTDDAPSGRRRRRQAEGDDKAVSASDLIAALRSDQVDSAPPTATAPEPPASISPEPEDGATVALPPDAPDSTDSGGATVLLPPRIGPNDPAPIRDLGDDPRTDFIPKMVGTTAEQAEANSIRAALLRQSADDLAAGATIGSPAPTGPTGNQPPPTDGNNSRLEHSDRPPRRRGGLLYASRSIAALVALITLLGVGVEWKIKDRADQGLQDNRVPAINTTDTHISTARTAATTFTNSKGVTTTESAKAAATYEPENILLLGSDTRSGTNAEVGTDSSTSNGVANSDTLMVAHISGDRQHVTVLSIPRDTIVPAPSCKVWNAATNKYSDQNNQISPGQTYHINSAYSVGGPKCTVTAVQSLTGLGITRVIGIDFVGFQAMVDALGGVTINVCRAVIDTELGTVIPQTGTQKIGGFQALNLVRARNVVGDTESDLARIRRQQVVLSAILRQVTAAGTLLNPAKLDNFLQAFTKNTFTDNVKVEDLVTLAGSLGSLDPAHVTFYTLPTVPSKQVSGALDVDSTKAPVIFDDLINDLPLPGEVTSSAAKPTTTALTPAPTSAPSLKITVDPAKVDLEIYNVSGQSNVATMAQEKLNAVGFKVSSDQLFKPESGTQTGTTVLYAPANRAAALSVAAAVPGSTLVVTPGLGTAVRLMIGSSYTGAVSAVSVGGQAPSSLATAISTGSSIDTTVGPTSGTGTTNSTGLSSVNAGTSSCV